MKVKIGTCPGNFAGENRDAYGRYRRMKELGYDTADVNLADTGWEIYSDRKLLEEYCAAEKEAAAAAGIELYQIHGPWPTDDTTEDSRKAVREHMHTAVYACRLLGAPYMVIHPQMPFGWDKEEDAAFAEELTVELLRGLIPDCERYGVTVCLENMPMKAHRISPVENIVAAVKKVGHPNIAVCLDTGHSNVFGHDLGEMVRLCGSRLKTLHIHDNDGIYDRHQLPYTGTADWDSFLCALAETGCGVPLNFETMAPAVRTMPEAVFAKAEELTALTARHMAEQVEKLRNGK